MNKVKAEETYVSHFGHGYIEAGHLWSEHKNDQAAALYLDADFEKAFRIDDISSVFHYDLIPHIGCSNLYTTGERERKDELKCGDFCGMLNEDKILNLHTTVSLSNASEDYILDVDFSKKVPELDCLFCEERSCRNSSSEIYSPATSNEVVSISEPSIPVPKSLNNELGKSTSGLTHYICGCETLVEDEMALKCLLTCDLQVAHETNDIQSLLEIGSSLDHSIKNTCFPLCSSKASCTSTCVQCDELCPASEDMEADELLINDLSTDGSAEVKTDISRRKRLSKPPQRYVEGPLWSKPKVHMSKKSSSSLSNDKGPRVQSQKKHNSKTSEDDAPKMIESNSEFDSDEEYDPLSSHFNIRKSNGKSGGRKSNNLWTLSEVVQLVDGIAHFGMGQWTAIKRSFFLTSYRTSTDIRDKWRNLVKTNCRNLTSEREGDLHNRSGTQPLPMSVIQRVRELVIAQPKPSSSYGSKRRPKLERIP